MTTGYSSIVAAAVSIVDTREMSPEFICLKWSIGSRVIVLLVSLACEMRSSTLIETYLGHFTEMLRKFLDHETIWQVLRQFSTRNP